MPESDKLSEADDTPSRSWPGAYKLELATAGAVRVSSYFLSPIFLLVTFQLKTGAVESGCEKENKERSKKGNKNNNGKDFLIVDRCKMSSSQNSL